MAVALLLAAGRGERLGSDGPKALIELAGRPMLQWSFDVLASVPAIERIVVALPPQALADTGKQGSSPSPLGLLLPPQVVCVPGGQVRSESVRLSLAVAGAGDPVLIHDAARPLLTTELVERTLTAAMAHGVDGAIAAAPVSDTIKRVEGEPSIVVETLRRSGLWAVQTPQVFRREALERALDVPDEVLAAATDDAWLVERAGGRVAIVSSTTENLKITGSPDIAMAETLLSGRPAPLRPGHSES